MVFKQMIAFLVSMFLTLAFTLNRAYTGENKPVTVRVFWDEGRRSKVINAG